jgi:TonB family protein
MASTRARLPVVGVVGLIACTLPLACNHDRPTASGYDDCPGINEFVPVEQIASMTYYQEPVYPRLAEQAGLEGIVWLKVQVNKYGTLTDAVVYKSSGTPALDDAALRAAPKCRFEPALQNGRPVCMWVTYKVVFSLH